MLVMHNVYAKFVIYFETPKDLPKKLHCQADCFDRMVGKICLRECFKSSCHCNSITPKSRNHAYHCILLFPKETMHQCGKNIRYTTYTVLNSSNSRYLYAKICSKMNKYSQKEGVGKDLLHKKAVCIIKSVPLQTKSEKICRIRRRDNRLSA